MSSASQNETPDTSISIPLAMGAVTFASIVASITFSVGYFVSLGIEFLSAMTIEEVFLLGLGGSIPIFVGVLTIILILRMRPIFSGQGNQALTPKPKKDSKPRTKLAIVILLLATGYGIYLYIEGTYSTFVVGIITGAFASAMALLSSKYARSNKLRSPEYWFYVYAPSILIGTFGVGIAMGLADTARAECNDHWDIQLTTGSVEQVRVIRIFADSIIGIRRKQTVLIYTNSVISIAKPSGIFVRTCD